MNWFRRRARSGALDEKTAAGIGLALNEASLLGAEYDHATNRFSATFSVLTLPDDDSPPPTDPRRQLLFNDVGRILASLRNAHWDEFSAEPVLFEISELRSVVESFGGQPVYGGEFINAKDRALKRWEKKPSLDVRPARGSFDNRLMLFQEAGVTRHLDLWVWFSGVEVFDSSGEPIALSEFIEGAGRWWDALHERDPRTDGHGIQPLD